MPRMEYGAIVVLAALFWLQSMKTLPLRTFLSIDETTSSGIAWASWSASFLAYSDVRREVVGSIGT